MFDDSIWILYYSLFQSCVCLTDYLANAWMYATEQIRVQSMLRILEYIECWSWDPLARTKKMEAQCDSVGINQLLVGFLMYVSKISLQLTFSSSCQDSIVLFGGSYGNWWLQSQIRKVLMVLIGCEVYCSLVEFVRDTRPSKTCERSGRDGWMWVRRSWIDDEDAE